jgi:uncharacterized protein (TIGR02231 family)
MQKGKKAETYGVREAAEQAPMPAITVENSEVNNGIASSQYSVPGKRDIASDNQDHQVPIATIDLPVTLSYTTIPKLHPAVFLKAGAANSSEFTLLPGGTSIFLNNAFVADGSLDLVTPAQAFETSLGVDEQIHVERKLINRFQKDEGVLSKRIKVLFAYSIALKNNKKASEEILVQDQLPVSKNQDITVSFVPAEKSPVAAPAIDKTGIAEWKVTANPGVETVIPFSFSVEYPKDIRVDGL